MPPSPAIPKQLLQIAKLCLSYHSDCPDGVDERFEARVAAQTQGTIEGPSGARWRRIGEHQKKADKSAERKKARAERAGRKRTLAKAYAAVEERLARSWNCTNRPLLQRTKPRKPQCPEFLFLIAALFVLPPLLCPV
jgi:hypothetical protein